MQVFRKIGISAGIFFVLVVGIGFLLPRHFYLQREILISTGPEFLFNILLDFEEFQKWSPWQEYNPNSQITYGNVKKGLNASFSWKGEKSGSGKMQIIEIKPPQEIITSLEFEDGGKAFAAWKITPQNNGSLLTWRFQMDSGYDIFLRYFTFFFLEKMLAKDYEKGLGNLKNYIENSRENLKK